MKNIFTIAMIVLCFLSSISYTIARDRLGAIYWLLLGLINMVAVLLMEGK